MKGGVTLFRGTGTAARRYLESDRSTADEYYLEGGTALAQFTVADSAGDLVDARTLDPGEYAAWVDWTDPLTGTSMGTPREAGGGKKGSPRFAEMVINAPKSLSIAAALYPEVSDALDRAQADAASEIRRWLGQHSVTRVGPRGGQEVVPVHRLQTVTVAHKTSRAGDPHRHIHFQIGTRVHAAGRWRALDTAALFRQQGAIRALGTAIIAAHPQLASVLDAHGLTLDPVTGEVAELERFNQAMSKRGAQVERNLARFEAEWEAAHPGEEAGPVVRARLRAKAWDHERPNKKPTLLGSEDAWRAELEDAGYTPNPPRALRPAPVGLDELSIEEVASRALDRAVAGSSAWTVHTLREHVTRITTEHGVQAAPVELREFVQLATQLAREGCFSVLPPGAPAPEHVAHLTSLRVVAAETELRDLLAARAAASTEPARDVHVLAARAGLDEDQERAAGVVASGNRLVVVEGAAGSGKTTMLRTVIRAAAEEGRAVRVVTPTKKAADVAHQDLGIPTDSVAALVHAHGYRWNADGVWGRLAPGDADPDTGSIYRGPAQDARLMPGERIVVDEAGMLDQDTALALLHVADEAGAAVALVGDRAQLPAVGRGGVLDIAARLTPAGVDMTSLHRFADPAYAALTLQLRHARNPAAIFDRLHEHGLIELHDSDDDMHDVIARTTGRVEAITAATNDDARVLNERIRSERVGRGEVDDARTVFGRDGLPIGKGDVIQTRRNDSEVGVANRQTWTVQHVHDDGALSVVETVNGRKRHRTVTLPAGYVTEDAHLAYAVTAYGVQGATVDAAHTLLSDGLDAAGVYVGMTRGRETNILHIVATDLDHAKQQFVDTLARDHADRGLAEATGRARAAVAGLIADGPVSTVNAERDRITERIAKAESEHAHWTSILQALHEQSQRHDTERQEQSELVRAADARAEEVLVKALAPLVQEATGDGTALLAMHHEAIAAHRAHATAGRFRRRAAARAAKDADTRRTTMERAVRARWQHTSFNEANLPSWAEHVAQQTARETSEVLSAQDDAATAHGAATAMTQRHLTESIALRQRLLGTIPYSAVTARITQLQEECTADRHYLTQIDALTPTEAAKLVQAHTVAEHARRQAAETARRAVREREVRLDPAPLHDTGRDGNGTEHGRSL